jgi:hypothetical protein
MKKQINEIKRMQQLSGIIKESQLNEYGMTSLEDEDIQDVKDIISLLRQAAEKADRIEMEDFAFKLRKDADDVEADLGNILGNM